MIESLAPITLIGVDEEGQLTKDTQRPDVTPFFNLIVRYDIRASHATYASGPYQLITDGKSYFRSVKQGQLIDDIPEPVRNRILEVLHREIQDIL
jgi:hypothetical protein